MTGWLIVVHIDAQQPYEEFEYFIFCCECRYEDILLQQGPLPTYGLKLLLALLEQHPAFIRCA